MIHPLVRRAGGVLSAGALIVSVLLAGCGTSSSATSSKSGAHAMANVHFILNWLPNVEFAGLWVAQQKGWWKQAGINMSFTPWSQSVHPETDVPAQGGNTFGFQSGAAIAIARSQNVPIEAVYTDTQKSVFGLTVMPNSGIKTVGDLRGKTVGYQPHELYVPETMLANAGLKPTQWKPVPVGFDIVMLTKHRVDAYLTFLTNEPLALKLQGVKTISFPASAFGFHFYDDVMFTTTSLIKKDPALVKKVVAVAARGFEWAHLHPAAAAKITVDHYFPAAKGTSAAANLKQQVLELKTFAPFSRDATGHYYGLMDTATWRDSINTLYRYGEIKSKPDPATIYTNQFTPYK